MRRRIVVAILAQVCLLLGAPPALALETLRPGDIVIDKGLAVVAPPRGMRVYAEKWLVRGGYQQLRVTTRWDGTVRVWSRGSERHATPGDGDAGGAGCDDDAHAFLGHRWPLGYVWSYNAATTPSYLSVTSVEKDLTGAAGNITGEDSPCTEADQVEAEHRYLGRLPVSADIRFGSLCDSHAQRDGLNAVDFGSLPSNVLGMSCTWSTLRSGPAPVTAVESDIRLNRNDTRWFTGATVSCDNEYSVEGVMTHEFGHSFGLGHVSEDGHASQTMSTHINGPCQRSEATLGRGDALGLRTIY